MSVFSDGYESQINRESRNLLKPVDDATGFLDNAMASYKHFLNEEQSVSRLRAMAPELDQQFAAYQEITGQQPPAMAFGIRTLSAGRVDLYERASRGEERALQGVSRQTFTGDIAYDEGYKAWKFWEDVAQQYPDKIRSYAQMKADVADKLADERQKNMEVMTRADGYGKVGQFAGVMAGAAVDPVNVATMGFGTAVTMAKGMSNAAKMLELAGKGFVINASTEALIQPNVYKWKKTIGSEYSASEAIENILLAGAGGSLFAVAPTAARITWKGVKKNVDKTAFRLKYAIDQGQISGIEAKASLDAVRALQQSLEQNPFKELDPSINGVRTHLTAMEKAVDDFRAGDVANVRGIVKAIDDEQYPAWQQLEYAKQVLRNESNQIIGDVTRARKDLDIYRQELQELQAPDAVKVVKEKLVAENRIPARQAKKEAKQFVESRRAELEERVTNLERDIAPLETASQAKQLLTKIRSSESIGKKPDEIISMLKRDRPELGEVEAMPRVGRKVAQQAPEREITDAPPVREVAQEMLDDIEMEYKAYESQVPEQAVAGDKANNTLYSDVDDVDLVNTKAMQDVERMLAEDDFFVPDDMGNLVSAREVLDEAIKGVDNAAEVKACFLGV